MRRAKSFGEKLFGGLGIAGGAEQELQRVASRVHCSVQIHPDPFDFDVDLIHPPGVGRALQMGAAAPKALQKRADEAVTIIGSQAVIRMLQQLVKITAVAASALWGPCLHRQVLAAEEPYSLAEHISLVPFPASHQESEYPAMGLRINLENIAICYSGDTRPHEQLSRWAHGAQVLIHEASLPEGEQQLAHRLGHSTAADAGRLAANAGARHLVLIHVNIHDRRKAEAAFVAEAQRYFTGAITIAREGML